MPKIGVYIPKDRMQDIEKWRKKLNFSAIFMEAFDAKIADYAITTKNGITIIDVFPSFLTDKD